MENFQHLYNQRSIPSQIKSTVEYQILASDKSSLTACPTIQNLPRKFVVKRDRRSNWTISIFRNN